MLARRLAIVFLALVVASLPAQPPKLDGNGDPLPAGAIARLGSVRFLHGDWPHSLAFLPDGRTLMAAGHESFVRVWNVADGREVRRFPADSRIASAALAPDGKTIAGCDGTTVLLWDAATGKELRRLSGLNRRALQVVWSPTSDWLAASSDEGVIVFWDVNTGAELKRIAEHKGVIRALVLSPDGKLLASAGQDQTLRIWDVDKGKELRRLEGETGFQAALTWSPDGKTIAGTCEIRSATGSRSSVRIWDAATGKMLHEVPGSFNCVAFSPDGKILVAGALAEVRLIDPATGKELRRLPGHFQHVMALAFSRDGSMLATSGFECRIRLWDTATWTEIRPALGHRGPVQSIAYGADGRTIVSGGLDQSIRFWDWPTNREIRKVDGLGTHWGILALARSPDGKKLISFEQDDSNGPYRVWDAATGKQLARFGERTRDTAAIAFTPDGKRVLTGHGDGSIGVWDAVNFKLERRHGNSKGRILAVAGLPDGERAVWAGEYQGAGLRNLSDGKDVRSFAGSPHHIIAGLALYERVANLLEQYHLDQISQKLRDWGLTAVREKTLTTPRGEKLSPDFIVFDEVTADILVVDFKNSLAATAVNEVTNRLKEYRKGVSQIRRYLHAFESFPELLSGIPGMPRQPRTIRGLLLFRVPMPLPVGRVPLIEIDDWHSLQSRLLDAKHVRVADLLPPLVKKAMSEPRPRIQETKVGEWTYRRSLMFVADPE